MSTFRRIVWNEGMLLGPHHFQQTERHLLGEMEFRLEVARPNAWGLRLVAIDEDALRSKRLSLAALEGILPDGTAVRLPAIDPVPSGRDLEVAFGSDRSSLDVFLALPDERPGTPRTVLGNGGGSTESRYVAEEAGLHDANDPGVETEILVCRQNLRLLVSGESLDGFTAIRIARLKKTDEGVIVLDPNYAPPSVAIQAAGPLPTILGSILDYLAARADVLASQTRESGGKVQFGASDVDLYWQLNTVNTAIPELSHYRRHGETHPMDAYLTLARLAGSLCTFRAGRRAREIPPYEHEDIGGTFRALEKMIRELGVDIQSKSIVRVPLERGDDGALLQGEVTDDRLLGSAFHWYLSVTGDLPEEKIRQDIPGKVTIGASHNVEFLVQNALRGVPVSFTAVPPRDFPIKSGHVYFRLENHGDTWDTVTEARSIAIYLRGAELRGLTLELIVMEA